MGEIDKLKYIINDLKQIIDYNVLAAVDDGYTENDKYVLTPNTRRVVMQYKLRTLFPDEFRRVAKVSLGAIDKIVGRGKLMELAQAEGERIERERAEGHEEMPRGFDLVGSYGEATIGDLKFVLSGEQIDLVTTKTVAGFKLHVKQEEE